MNSIQIFTQHNLSSKKSKAQLIPLQDKLEILRISMEETQKYELLTTNQYLPQIELVVGILEELSKCSRET
jgi:hypothetical protein